jgi:hypothetical protein
MTLADQIRALKKPAKPDPRYGAWNAALERAADLVDTQLPALLREAETRRMEIAADDWKSDPAANEAWNAGCDFAMTAMCRMLKVDPHSVSWDAATEELDSDVMSVICNIMTAAFGDGWYDAILAAAGEADNG